MLSYSRYSGFIVIALMVIAAALIDAVLPGLGKATWALLLGAILINVFKSRIAWQYGFKIVEKHILELGIVLLAFGLNFNSLKAFNPSTLMMLSFMVVGIIALSTVLAKRFGLSKSTSVLVGAGTAICGSAAIAAVSPLIKATEDETAASIGSINFVGLLGLLSFPIILAWMPLEDPEAALLIGGSLQSMGHVVGASFAISDTIGQEAVLFKMVRILFLVPIILYLWMVKRKKEKANGLGGSLPWFIIAFAIFLGLAQINFFKDNLNAPLSELGGWLIIAAMVAIGAKIKIKKLLNISRKSLKLAFVLYMVQIVFLSSFIYLMTS